MIETRKGRRRESAAFFRGSLARQEHHPRQDEGDRQDLPRRERLPEDEPAEEDRGRRRDRHPSRARRGRRRGWLSWGGGRGGGGGQGAGVRGRGARERGATMASGGWSASGAPDRSRWRGIGAGGAGRWPGRSAFPAAPGAIYFFSGIAGDRLALGCSPAKGRLPYPARRQATVIPTTCTEPPQRTALRHGCRFSR